MKPLCNTELTFAHICIHVNLVAVSFNVSFHQWLQCTSASQKNTKVFVFCFQRHEMDACRRKFQLWKHYLEKEGCFHLLYSCLRTYTNGHYSGRRRVFVKDNKQLLFSMMTGIYQITSSLEKWISLCNLFWRSMCEMEERFLPLDQMCVLTLRIPVCGSDIGGCAVNIHTTVWMRPTWYQKCKNECIETIVAHHCELWCKRQRVSDEEQQSTEFVNGSNGVYSPPASVCDYQNNYGWHIEHSFPHLCIFILIKV